MYFLNPSLLGLLFSLILFLVLIYLEFKRSGKRKYLRIFTSFILCLSLFLLFAEPVIKKATKKGQLIILTSNYQDDDLDSLKTLYSSAGIVQWDTLDILEDRFSEVFVIGSGIPPYDLWKLEGLNVQYVAVHNIPGYQSINFPGRATQDDLVKVAGKYKNVTNDSLKLLIRFRDDVFDSTYLPPRQTTRFELEATALFPGRFEYLIEVFKKDSLVSSDVMPLEISDPKKYRILMVNGFPTFELRYLKNYLVAQGHEVIVRNNISIARYAFESYNTEISNLKRFSGEYLRKFDVLILDLESLKGFGESEKNELVKSIQNGLNLFLLPEEALFSYRSDLLPRFSEFTGNDKIQLMTLDIDLNLFPYLIKPTVRLSELIVDNTVVGYKNYKGLGSVSSLYLTNTYPLQLRGDTVAYKHIWHTVFDQVVRPADPLKLIKSKFPIKNRPFDISFLAKKTSNVSYDQNRIGVKASFLKGRSSIRLWPTKTGWDNFAIEGERSWFYVYDESQWTSVRDIHKSLRNIEAHSVSGKQIEKAMVEKENILRILLYLIIICCGGFLWVEPKL